MTGNDGVLRLRIKDFRVTFTETNDTVNVLDVGPRGDIYNSQAFLPEIESGQKPGTAATLKKIADALRLKVDDLL